MLLILGCVTLGLGLISLLPQGLIRDLKSHLLHEDHSHSWASLKDLSVSLTDPHLDEMPALSELFRPREGESWIAGASVGQRLASSDHSSEPLLVALWTRTDPGTFFLADAVNASTNTIRRGRRFEVISIELPKAPEAPTDVEIPRAAWAITAPVFYDATFRIWKALGSPHSPGVLLIDRQTGKILQSWTARAFIDSVTQGQDVKGPREPTEPASPTEHLSEALDLSPTLLGQTSFVMDALLAEGSYFLADAAAHKILRISKTGEFIASFGDGHPGRLDGAGSQAQFRFPHRLAYWPQRRMVVVADWGNHSLRGISLDSGTVVTLYQKEGPEGLLPEDITIVGDRMLVTGALDNKIEIFHFDADSDLIKTRVLLPPHWLRTTVLTSSKPDILYLGDPASPHLHVLNLISLEQFKIESTTLVSPQTRELQTPAKRIGVLKEQTLALVMNPLRTQSVVALSTVGAETTELLEAPDAEVQPIHGISANGERALLWNSETRRLCDLSLENLKDRKTVGPHCLNYAAVEIAPEQPSSDSGTPGDPAQGDSSVPELVVKGGTLSQVTVHFSLAKDEVFSPSDVHLVRTSAGEIFAWNPQAQQTFSYQGLKTPGRAWFEFSPVLCKKAGLSPCRRVQQIIHVDVRTTYSESTASFDQRLQL